MDESLARFRTPEAERVLCDLLCTLVKDIRLILIHPDLGNAAKLAAIAEAVDELAPPPGPDEPGGGASSSIAALLARNPVPATILLEELAGEEIRFELTTRANRPLTARECSDLYASPGVRGHQRSGILRTASSGLVAAAVNSLVIPDRLPVSVQGRLGMLTPADPAVPDTPPLGKVLAGLGARREPLSARVARGLTATGEHMAVESTARLWLAGLPAALASEQVTAGFCDLVADRLACAGGMPVRSALRRAGKTAARSVAATALHSQ